MGNNNATASLTVVEEESSKLETNGMSPLEPVSVDATQKQVFLASGGKDGDQEKESFSDGVTGKEKPEIEQQSPELVEDPKAKKVEEEVHPSGLESLVTENDEQLQKQTSVEEGVQTVAEFKEQCLALIGTQSEVKKLSTTEIGKETLCEATEVEELSMIETQSFVRKLETTESGNEEKPCVIDEIVSVSPTFCGTVATEEKKIDEYMDVTVPAEEVVKLDQETGLEERTGLHESKPEEIPNLEYLVVVDDDEVTNEENADQVISKPEPQESEAIQETDARTFVKEKEMESIREASLKRMSRCRSLPVSHNSRVTGDSLVKQFVSEVTFPSRNKMGLENSKTSETLLVSYVGSNKVEKTTEVITECSQEARLEMRSPSFGSDLRIKESGDEPMEKTPLLCVNKTETYEATIDVEEKTVMLKRSETEKTRGFELSLGLSLTPSGRSEVDDSFKETKDLGDNLMEKKVSLGSMKGRVRKRSKSSIFGTCLCCANFAGQQV